jgi:hypothetical protein
MKEYPMRFDEFTTKFATEEQTKDTGRPPHDPVSMLMLYLYGYLNRVRSSRRLEAQTRRNVEVMWQGHFRLMEVCLVHANFCPSDNASIHAKLPLSDRCTTTHLRSQTLCRNIYARRNLSEAP